MFDPQVEWDMVGEAFYAHATECHSCEYFTQEYYTDTGLETSCRLLDMDGGNPGFCLALDRIKEEMEDE
tara:strand:- start:319 stop:525 length:207 start_codon:yes stop_codon:yes gene_type:complete